MSRETGAEPLPDLFARALELDRAGRSALLAEVNARDAALATELRRLLAEEEKGALPLDRSPWSDAGRGAAEDAESEPLPERIAGFRVVRELGRGGMGRVFFAEEETADFRRNVALKIISRPGDDEAVRRFRDEVRILSALEHPGIAHFLSGGRAADGTWYLALEHVDGEDLLAFSKARGLDVRQRVELFLAALVPVRFAHERGVVHRDLKPSHLLIDRDGNPRLLDFGISKLIDPATQASVALTRTESRALTPGYASPEQFRGEVVTPASDVYSLGVVLYELLAGRRPFADMTGTALERAVLERDPEPPSTIARQTRSAEAPRATGTRPKHRGFGRDLDAICLKALRKQPGDRYIHAGELADDLRRYLDGLPVAARRGGRRYRLGRFLHRHRGRVGLSAAALLAVLALLLAARAEREAASLRPPEPPKPKPFPFSSVESTPLAELQSAFTRSPSNVEAGAALAIALSANSRQPEARLVVARLRQIPGRAEDPLIDYVDANVAMDSGEPQRALVLFTRARDTALAGGRGELVGQIRASRGRLLSTMGERDEARREMETARREIEKADDPASLSRVLNDLAIELLQQGELAHGSELLEAGVVAARRGEVSPEVMLLNLGLVSLARGRPDVAEPRLAEVVATRRAGNDGRRLGQALGFYAESLADLGRQSEAIPLLDQAIAMLRTPGGEATLVPVLVLRARVALERGELAAVDALAHELEEVASRAGEKNGLAFASFYRGRTAAERGDLGAARHEFDLARRLLVDNGDLDQASDMDVQVAAVERRAGKAELAVAILDAAAARLPESGELRSGFLAGAERVRIAADRSELAAAAEQFGRLDPANESSPSVTGRLAYLGARAALNAARGESAAAARDFDAGSAAAMAAGRELEALALRLDRTRVRPASDRERDLELAGIEQRATELGLEALARRARELAALPRPAPPRNPGPGT